MSIDLTELSELQQRYQALELDLQNPDLAKNQKLYSASARRLTELGRLLNLKQKLKKVDEHLQDARNLQLDQNPEIRELASDEIQTLTLEKSNLEEDLKVLLLPRDPNDDKNIIVEIRAGTGGDEASLFAADLFRMYHRFAETMHWKTEILSQNQTDTGGFREIIFSIEGDGVYSRLKLESGVHRVQRVPTTETQGRIHTSTVTVAILPEAEEVEVDIKPEDVRVDVYRSSGPGGQSVNTTDSAVRVTHIQTGLVVTCQDEKSQLKNKLKALKVLRARLYDRINAENRNKISEERREQVGTGDRSERIRTYNFPQGRMTDHRVGLTLYRLNEILNGDLTEVITKVGNFYQTKALLSADKSNG
ncbi:MAG: peptide chain release factor 1 [Deltaproteobacteria bacterium]|jgi:peptide chain release factor 1|nr:peptide chain release factor 1 [Deltaproteobacteria bacterium]